MTTATATTTVAAPAATAVSAEQRFLFDLQGFVVLRGALAPDDRRELLAAVRRLEEQPIDDSWRRRLKPEHRERAMETRQDDGRSVRLNGLLRLDQAFDPLIDHPAVLPFLRGFMGDPQLGNTWSISKREGAGVLGWHRGATPMQYWCRDGVIRSAMLNVVWFLTDNGPDDGCMAAVPGSHKSDLARLGAYEEVPVGGADFDYQAYPGLALPGSVPITGRAGDVLVMSEALIHGGLPKATPGLRTNLYFNHVHRLAASAGYEPANMRHFWLPERLRARLTPPRRGLTRWMEQTRYELDE